MAGGIGSVGGLQLAHGFGKIIADGAFGEMKLGWLRWRRWKVRRRPDVIHSTRTSQAPRAVIASKRLVVCSN